MSNDLVRVFNNNEFGQVRTLMIDGVPWFVGKDVAAALGYERETKAVVDHIDDEDRKMVDGKTQSHFGIELGQRGGWLINESGMYSLILDSKLPIAKKFKRWVTSEVLPAIRQNGGYGNALPPINFELFYAIGDKMKALESLELENASLKEANESIRFTPNKDGNYTVSSIAQVYGMTAQELNIILRDKGIQYKDPSNGKWRLCTKYLNKGYEAIRAYYQHTDGTMSWTPEGLEFLKERMACWGYKYKQN
nr:MAG TPA: repressor domain protein [Bacteriophage sp.]